MLLRCPRPEEAVSSNPAIPAQFPGVGRAGRDVQKWKPWLGLGFGWPWLSMRALLQAMALPLRADAAALDLLLTRSLLSDTRPTHAAARRTGGQRRCDSATGVWCVRLATCVEW